MMKTKVALLPLYLALYDELVPDARERMESFVSTVSAKLAENGLSVVDLPVSRVSAEFAAAVAKAEDERVDAIVTLHLAYSPSLESIDALTGTKLPIIVLDTTPGFEFSASTDPDELLFNHGIHGVQDMCNLLMRRGRPFLLEAGHYLESDVCARVAADAVSAGIAVKMRNSRIGRIGEPFKGMGDFSISSDVMAEIGVATIAASPADVAEFAPSPDAAEVAEEMLADRARFDSANLADDVLLKSEVSGLAVRKWMAANDLTGFTANFQEITKDCGLEVMPFLEASKAMSRGQGYAGEGDVLTAALVGALATRFPETTFTEMFCPDWRNGTLFLSHMGEMNCDLTAEKAVLMEKKWIFSDADAPVVAVGRFKSGPAVLANLAPGPDDSFALILAPVSVVDPASEDKHVESVRGWIKPPVPLSDFLAEYSLNGGTHHSALVYDGNIDQLANFAVLMGWEYAVIE
jgi:L-arabinose isomerase